MSAKTKAAAAAKGEYYLELGGKKLRVVFDWHGISSLSDLAGPAGIERRMNRVDASFIAAALEIGLRKHHPEIKAEQIMEASPPLQPVMATLNAALGYALHGSPSKKKE